MAFKKVCKTTDVAAGDSKEYRVLNKNILLINANGKFHCLSSLCPHAGAPLARGIIKGEELQCPWHGNLFRITDGTSVYAGGWTEEPLKVYPCEVRDDYVYVNVTPGEKQLKK
jgi:nitrite reductase/ring-hydroxylating ferredoxin subunit